MHDDRIAGVTFEENALRNALIVNEEYAWVGNPFSAPKQEGRIQKVLPSFFCMPVHEGLGTCDLKAPLPGVGGICHNSRNRSRAARVRVPFSAPKQKGEPSEGSPFARSAVAVRVSPPPDIPDSLDFPGKLRAGGAEASRWCFLLSIRSSGPSRIRRGMLQRAIIAAPTTVPHPCVCGASGRVSTPRAP